MTMECPCPAWAKDCPYPDACANSVCVAHRAHRPDAPLDLRRFEPPAPSEVAQYEGAQYEAWERETVVCPRRDQHGIGDPEGDGCIECGWGAK